jgi:two-component system, cell cycle sensor histidine kinase and response regulator CckA
MRYRAIVENLEDAVFVCDLGGKIIDVNQQAIVLTGQERQVLLSKSFQQLTTSPKRLLWAQQITAKLGEKAVHGEYTLKTSSGSRLSISLVAYAIAVEGQATTISLVVRDQSEREKLQRELWSRGMRLQNFLENATEAILATDLQGRILEWNQGAVALFGYQRDEIINENIEILVPEERHTELNTLRQRLLNGGTVRDYITERLHKDGHRLTVAVSRSLIYGENGEIVGSSSIMRDISERQRSEEILLRAQKMESLGTMAGGIAHDFNNILGVILSFASAQLMDGPNDPELREDLRIIIQSAERGADLARQLLTLSKPKEGNRDEVDIEGLLRFVEKLLSRILDRRISLITEIEPNLPVVIGERTKIEQVLLNLCLNARDSITENGTIRLEAKRSHLDEESALRLGGRTGEYIVLRVSDSGSGMDRETLTRIFDPYFTTKGRGRGTGLGLTMVYAIVQGHDGFLTVDSVQNVGSTFEVYLPTTTHQHTIHTLDKHFNEEISQSGGTILLIDDEEDLRRAGKRILSRHGYQILTAADGEEALQIYQGRAGEIDLVLLDMVMPKLDGRAVFRRLREIDPEAKIILVSGYAPDNGVEELFELGLTRYLKKPFTAEALLAEVKRVIG